MDGGGLNARGFMAPEAELLLLCAQRQPQQPSGERMREILAAGIDGRMLLEFAARHAVRPLLFHQLDAVQGQPLPREVFAALWSWTERAAVRARSMARELVDILRSFECAGLPALPHKGPALALQLYADVTRREFCDLDIVVRAADLRGAHQCLITRGYVADRDDPATLARARAQYHAEYQHPASKIRVELHWKTDPLFAVEDSLLPPWWERAPDLDFQGHPVRTLPPTQLLEALCLHGSKHHWSQLGWLVDVAELLRAGPAFDWDALRGDASRRGCEHRVALGFRLAHELLRAPLDASVHAWIASHRAALDGPAASITAALFQSPSREPGAFSRLALDVRLLDRVSDRVSHAAGVIFRPTAQDEHAAGGLRAAAVPFRIARLLRKHFGA